MGRPVRLGIETPPIEVARAPEQLVAQVDVVELHEMAAFEKAERGKWCACHPQRMIVKK